LAEKDNVVYIGRKPPMSYVLAVLTGFSVTKGDEIVLKARGRAISTAVDVAEISRRRFVKGLEVSDITIGTEEMTRESGETRGVSTIEITLKQPKAEEKTKAEEKNKPAKKGK